MVIAALFVGLVAGALIIRAGWEVPVREYCPTDACVQGSWFDVDWGRVDWKLTPTRLACFETNPSEHSVLIGPGDECVRANGTGTIERRATYEQLQTEARQQRIQSLVLAGAALVTPLMVVLAHARIRAMTGATTTGRGGA
ncbi:hypothetical protein [Dactylosporangium sp. CS-033363]|uniref:hypothetical protein n=1 Tax=Dactylosporangium sp. CS-033363 TaxID=3239935 RepID=UPI003D8BC0F8